jgi:hypothetical protein
MNLAASRVARLVTAVFLLSTASVGMAQESAEDAQLYFSNGVDLLSRNPPAYQDAYYQFKLAFEKSGSWKALGNLGLCALNLERDGEALGYYKRYLSEGGSEVDPEEAKALKRELLLIEGNLAIVTVESDIADLQITDTRVGTSVPAQVYRLSGGKLELGIRAGTHTLVAHHGDADQKWEVVLAPGSRERHLFSFGSSAAVAAPAPASGEPAPAGDSSAEADSASSGGGSLRTVGFVTLGVGGAALIGGAVAGLISNGQESDARALCRSNDCPESSRDKFDSAGSTATIANVLLIGGGVLAATGLGLVLFGGSSDAQPEAQARSIVLTPVVHPQMPGVTVWGSF